ncbi:glycosyltransferase [Polynucleobacter sp. HIN5]|uniref:glycosyltransferase n=1 Tax=Polynucleobacter sp. HIN5 TaxID=3047864 RepID=UPI0025747ED4|nr:glycosyltransferase [Polynucleobacter sp. HIN5]BEI32950.1 glycosyltransferase [Polynucleobacter sp. HIN5]
MKILVLAVNISQSSGGGKTGTLNICKALLSKGHEVCLYTTKHSDKNEFSNRSKIVEDYEGVPTKFFNSQFALIGNIFSFDLCLSLFRDIRHYDLVLVQSLYQLSSTAAAFIARLYKVPYIIRPHGTLDPVLFFRRYSLLKKFWLELFEKRNFRFAKAIQYSSFSEMLMTSSFIPNLAPGIVITEGIPVENIPNSDSLTYFHNKYPHLSDKRILLFLGRLHQKKGIELAIEAFLELSQQVKNVHFVIIGPGCSDYVQHLKVMVHSKGLQESISFLGPVSERMKFSALMTADIFVLPSYGENFGIAVIEALACGLPVLISDKVAISPELQKYGVAVVTECCASQISEALFTMLNDESLKKTISSLGPKIVSKYYSLQAMSEQIDHAYRKTLLN